MRCASSTRRSSDVRIVITGAGAAGSATARMLLAAGAGEVLCADRHGLLHPGRRGARHVQARAGRGDEPGGVKGSADEALAGADVYIGLSSPGAVSVEGIRSMAPDPIVFAMANPNPEVAPEEIEERGRGARHGPIGLSEPDQQRARLPRCLPGGARRARQRDHARDGARRRARAGGCGRRRAPGGRLRAAERLRPDASRPPSRLPSSRAAEESGVARRRRTPTPAGA